MHNSGNKKKIIRVTTTPGSIIGLLRGQLKFMSQYYEVVGISSGKHLQAQIEREQEIRTIDVAMTRTISPFKDIVSVWKLYKIFKEEKPFIVHTHTPKAGTVGMLAAKLAGVKHRLHTVAGLPLMEASGPKRVLLDFVEKLTYSWATKVYPNSHGLKEIILSSGFTSPSKVKVIGHGSSNGVDTSFYYPEYYSEADKEQKREQLGIPKNHFIYLFVGRVVKDKGINELVSAFVTLNQQHPNTTLLLVGGYEKELDPLKPETEKAIQSHKNIVQTGADPEVRPYYSIANVLVFPSYREGFPNTVMEASAMGLASIVSDINGCNEIIKHGENGLIIPPKNETALLEAMLQTLENKQLLKKLASKARPMIEEKYKRPYVWQCLLEEYKSLENV